MAEGKASKGSDCARGCAIRLVTAAEWDQVHRRKRPGARSRERRTDPAHLEYSRAGGTLL